MMQNILKHIKLEIPNPSLQLVRYKQIFTRKPRAPHYDAQRLARVVKPVYPKPFDVHFPAHLKCRKILEKSVTVQEENPYERIIANGIRDEVLKSKMTLIIHRNPVMGHFFHKSRIAFKKAGMTLFRNTRQTVGMALENTKYVSILSLFHSHTLLLCSPEPDVYAAYSLLKTMPFYVVLAGIVEDKLVSRHTLDQYGQLRDINAARAQIAHTLNTPAALIAHNISLYGETLESDSK